MTPAQTTLLDTLRATAAQAVLIGHIYSMVLYPDRTLGLGDFGVVLFFILSGFLITYTTLDKVERPGYGFVRYLEDRFCRIFVPYLPALLLVLLVDTAVFTWTDTRTYQEHYTLRDFVASALMLQQHPAGLFLDQILGLKHLKLSTFSSARPLWTVAVEWWLYLVFGLLLFRGKQIATSRKWQLALLACGAVPIFNVVAGTGAGLSLVWFIMSALAYAYHQQQKRVDAFIAAVSETSCAYRSLLVAIPWLLIALIGARLLWTGFLESRQPFARFVFYDFNLYALLVLITIYAFLRLATIQGGKRNQLARFAADYSYSLYLIHYSLIFLLEALGLRTGTRLLDLLIYFIACNGFAIAFWFVFERNYRQIGICLFRHAHPASAGRAP